MKCLLSFEVMHFASLEFWCLFVADVFSRVSGFLWNQFI